MCLRNKTAHAKIIYEILWQAISVLCTLVNACFSLISIHPVYCRQIQAFILYVPTAMYAKVIKYTSEKQHIL